MKANDSRSNLSYLNKLADQYNYTYHYSIDKNPINADYSALTKNVETNLKAPKFKKLMMESKLLSMRIFWVKVILKMYQEKYLLLILCWKLMLGIIKLKIYMEKTIGKFSEK